MCISVLQTQNIRGSNFTKINLPESAKLYSVGLQDHSVPQNDPMCKDLMGKTETKQQNGNAASVPL